MSREFRRRTLAAARVEALKARRSRLPWVTGLVFTVAPGIAALFSFVAQDPARARSLGLLGAKAELTVGDATWEAHLALLAQIAAVGGLVVFGLVLSWVFGREFSDGTAKDLLALPTPRSAVVTAKFLVAIAWCLLLAVQLLVLGVLAAVPLQLPGGGPSALTRGALTLLAVAALTLSLTFSLALAACLGRGYLPAVGALFTALFLAQVLAALGYGRYFPFSVPGLLAGVTGSAHPAPDVVGYGLVVAVGLGSWLATALWWQRADHPR